jgi:peptidoglycan-associated lipoprotein
MKKIARLIALLVFAVAVASLAGCAKRAAEAPPETAPAPAPAPTPAPPAPETPPTPAPTPPAPPAGLQAGDLKPAFFDFDSYALTAAARTVLDANARLLRDNPSSQVVIEGHCDERGTVEYNQALGERRAQAARDYLAAAGIDAARVSVISYGKERPFAVEHDEAAWAQNRRAHFVLR